MDFKSWLTQTRIDDPTLESFIAKLEPFFSDSGFNGVEFERKINLGLQKIDSDIDELLRPETDVKN